MYIVHVTSVQTSQPYSHLVAENKASVLISLLRPRLQPSLNMLHQLLLSGGEALIGSDDIVQ